jgi:hypothetical protein
MFWLFLLAVGGVPCAVFVALASFHATSRWAVWLWRIGMVAFGWLSGSIIRGGVEAPATTEDLQTRISLVMGIWVLVILTLLLAFFITSLIVWLVPRTRAVGKKALLALALVPVAFVGGYLLRFVGF